MKFLRYITEEYVTLIKGRSFPYSVYVNPTPDDFKELLKEMKKSGNTAGQFARYIADKNSRNVFVWDAFAGVHEDVVPYIKKAGYKLGYMKIQQVAPIKNNKLLGVELEDICDPSNYKWASKYIEYDWDRV